MHVTLASDLEMQCIVNVFHVIAGNENSRVRALRLELFGRNVLFQTKGALDAFEAMLRGKHVSELACFASDPDLLEIANCVIKVGAPSGLRKLSLQNATRQSVWSSPHLPQFLGGLLSDPTGPNPTELTMEQALAALLGKGLELTSLVLQPREKILRLKAPEVAQIFLANHTLTSFNVEVLGPPQFGNCFIVKACLERNRRQQGLASLAGAQALGGQLLVNGDADLGKYLGQHIANATTPIKNSPNAVNRSTPQTSTAAKNEQSTLSQNDELAFIVVRWNSSSNNRPSGRR